MVQSKPMRRPFTNQRGRRRKFLPTILGAATRLFAERGFDQPTMDQVAKAAGVTKATLYTYFDSKSVLIDAVIDQWLHEVPVATPVVRGSGLRQNLIDIGWQLHNLSSHPTAVLFAKRLGEIEHRLTPLQLQAWRLRYAAIEDDLATILERHCDCERPACVAHQFVILSVGGMDLMPASLPANVAAGIEHTVELVLRAYPERRVTPALANTPLRPAQRRAK